MIRTYQPKKRQRARTTGFRVRSRKAPKILKARRAKGRYNIVPA